jgi:hypothetical protein
MPHRAAEQRDAADEVHDGQMAWPSLLISVLSGHQQEHPKSRAEAAAIMGSTDRIPVKVSPNTAPHLAQGSVAFVYKKFGFTLPYTPASLILVDAIVDKIKATGATEQQASGVLSGLGCYVGEVFVRHAKASWRWTAEMGMPASCRSPVVVALPGVIGCDAIGKVFERFGDDGATESVALLYEIAVAARLDDRSFNR